MDFVIEFKLSAFRHGFTEADIRHAILKKINYAPLVDFPDKHGIVGFDTRGNPVEVLYNPVDDDTISVFHARKLQQDFIAKLSI
jgi:hypothetical protein